MRTSLAALLVSCLLAGCSVGSDGSSDKAGGSETPAVLRLAYPYEPNGGQPDVPALRYFAARAAELSGGSLRVRIVFEAAGNESPELEKRVAGMVRHGQSDLAWVAARVWDEFGVLSFQALQGPFLVTDYGLLQKVTDSPLAGEMLRGLDRLGVSGLALVPETLRHPAGESDPLQSVDDYDGALFRDIPSKATDALVSALGATPVHVPSDSFGEEVRSGNVDSTETPISRARGGWTLTGNVVLYGKANTIVANSKALVKLSDEQRTALRKAAEDTARRGLRGIPSERTAAKSFCAAGRVVNATAAQVEGLRAAAQPVYADLERDDLTRSLIARIRAMKASGSPAPTPAPCGRTTVSRGETGKSAAPAAFDGTYRWKLTRAGAIRTGNPPSDPDVGSVVTMTLDDGRWLLGSDPHYSGSFKVKGNRLVFDWPSEASVLTFAFRREGADTLVMKPVLPMDRGDQFVWGSAPAWQRVGPPVRDVP
jgi:TRAP-type C4-dicarboxylate transport system substrate-binding protein